MSSPSNSSEEIFTGPSDSDSSNESASTLSDTSLDENGTESTAEAGTSAATTTTEVNESVNGGQLTYTKFRPQSNSTVHPSPNQANNNGVAHMNITQIVSPIPIPLSVTTTMPSKELITKPTGPPPVSKYILVKIPTASKQRFEYYVAEISGIRKDKTGKTIFSINYFRKTAPGLDGTPKFTINEQEKGLYEIRENEIAARLPFPKVEKGIGKKKLIFNFNFDDYYPLGTLSKV